MSSNSVQSVDRILDLARALVQRFDSNRDGQLSQDEFGSMLRQVLGSEPGATFSGTAAAASSNAAATTSVTSQLGRRIYAPMLGFNTAKLNNASHLTPKYIFARAWQDKGQADMALLKDEDARKAYMEKFLASLTPEFEKQGWRVLAVKNEKLQLEGGPDNTPPHWIDTVIDIGGRAAGAWNRV